MEFSSRIVVWQRMHGRHDLPWQDTRDAYRVWLSEVMLQQTQVATVIPYYQRFVERFPDVHSLASAPLDAVLAAWAGLGYYSRARLLHRCAQQVVERHAGRLPGGAAALEALPGIGRSTAAAIAVFAGGERAAILDGNVKRVFARHFGIEGFPGSAATQAALWRAAERELPHDDVAEYTQGLMDLGATVCARSRPRCGACPVSASCVALREQRIAQLPAPRPRRERPQRSATLALLLDEDAVLLERRAPSGIWGGLLSAPEFDDGIGDEQLQCALGQRYGVQCRVLQRLPVLRHEFTHYSFLMQPRVVEVTGGPAAAQGGLERIVLRDAAAAALPAPLLRLLQALETEPFALRAT